MKIPSNGPWFEVGDIIIGPTKPKIKPIEPVITPPIKIYVAKLFEILPNFFQTKYPMVSEIRSDITIGINLILGFIGISENGIKEIK